MKYEAVIFDLDGTLVHTKPEYRYKVVGQTLKELQAQYTQHHIDRFWFEARRDEIIREQFGIDPDIFWPIFRKYDSTELRQQFTKTYEDVGFIKELKKSGYKTAIVTGAPDHITELEVDMLGKENFDHVLMATEKYGIRRKPDPHGLQNCLKILGIAPDRAIYIGNADEDVHAAKNANMLDVLVLRGEHEFSDIRPSLSINSLYDLKGLLEI